MSPALTVNVECRIPASTKIRLKVGWLFSRLALMALTERTVSRLAYDVRVGRGRWTRHYVRL